MHLVKSNFEVLMNLESLNLDSCKIGDEGLSHLKGNPVPWSVA
jgi:Leucine Rich repeat